MHKYSFALDKYADLMYIVLMIRICSGTGRGCGRRSYDPAAPGVACAGRTRSYESGQSFIPCMWKRMYYNGKTCEKRRMRFVICSHGSEV